MHSRHIRPRSISDAHVFGGGYHGQVELVVQAADDVGFEWDDVVHIPLQSCCLPSLEGKAVSLNLHKLEEFVIERFPGGNFGRPTLCSGNSGLQPHRVGAEHLSRVFLAPAGYLDAGDKLIAGGNRESAARACAQPPYVSDSGPWRAGAINHNKPAELCSRKRAVSLPKRCPVKSSAFAMMTWGTSNEFSDQRL